MDSVRTALHFPGKYLLDFSIIFRQSIGVLTSTQNIMVSQGYTPKLEYGVPLCVRQPWWKLVGLRCAKFVSNFVPSVARKTRYEILCDACYGILDPWLWTFSNVQYLRIFSVFLLRNAEIGDGPDTYIIPKFWSIWFTNYMINKCRQRREECRRRATTALLLDLPAEILLMTV